MRSQWRSPVGAATGFILCAVAAVTFIRAASPIWQNYLRRRRERLAGKGAFVLRGYPPGAFVGRQYNLANLEYRFPIGWIERGASTLPFFVHGISGALFGDYGGAFDKFDPEMISCASTISASARR